MNIPKKYTITLIIMLFGTTIGSLTQTVMTTALPQIVKELQIPVAMGQWLTTIYMLMVGVLVPMIAFLTHRYSTRILFIACSSCFFLGSVLALISHSFILLLAGRVLQAAGTGIMLPLLQLVVLEIVPSKHRGAAMGVVGLTIGFAPAIGPVIAGWITDQYGWQSNFVMLSVLSGAVLLAAIFFVRSVGETENYPLDKTSVVLSTIAFSGLLFGFTNLGEVGITSVVSWLPISVGAVCLTIFSRRQLQISQPLLDLRVFKNRDFAVGTILVGLLYMAFMGVGIVLPIYIQTYRGFSALQSGLIMLPAAVLMAVSGLVAGALMDRMGARKIILAGSLCLGAGTLLMTMLSDHTGVIYIASCMVLRMLGLGILIMPVTTWCVNRLSTSQFSDGTAVITTVRQVAGAIGSAVMVTVMTVAQKHVPKSITADSGIYSVDISFLFSFAMCIVVLVLAFIFVRSKPSGTGKGSGGQQKWKQKHRDENSPELRKPGEICEGGC